MSDSKRSRTFGAHAPHPTPRNPHPTTAISWGPRDLAALLLRSSLTHQRMGSLRSSAQTHALGGPAPERLAVNRNQSPRHRPGSRATRPLPDLGDLLVGLGDAVH